MAHLAHKKLAEAAPPPPVLPAALQKNSGELVPFGWSPSFVVLYSNNSPREAGGGGAAAAGAPVRAAEEGRQVGRAAVFRVAVACAQRLLCTAGWSQANACCCCPFQAIEGVSVCWHGGSSFTALPGSANPHSWLSCAIPGHPADAHALPSSCAAVVTPVPGTVQRTELQRGLGSGAAAHRLPGAAAGNR